MNDRWHNLGLLVLRLGALYLSLNHGIPKITALASGAAQGFIDTVAALGFPAPVIFAWLAALAEALGGLLLFLGFFTRWVAPVVAFNMFVVAFIRHHALEQWLAKAGIGEVSAETLRAWGSPVSGTLYLIIVVALLLLGPGQWSLDAKLRKKT
jgi:putative oxidoreductase